MNPTFSGLVLLYHLSQNIVHHLFLKRLHLHDSLTCFVLKLPKFGFFAMYDLLIAALGFK